MFFDNLPPDVVTCVALDRDSGYLVAGSADQTCSVWRLPRTAGGSTDSKIEAKPLHTLYGHDAVITTVAASADLDVVVSGAKVSHDRIFS